ncbi:MAG: hypothetical protein FWC86_06550 [Coriobacteriia bacterium]|nr:hypothetical protein [Coriobacteriia bacterium]
MTKKTAHSDIVCTYDAEKQSIAWFDTSEGQVSFIGYGSTAPESTSGFDQSSEPWFVSGVSLVGQEDVKKEDVTV